MMNVRALGIKGGWYKIAQHRKQWSNVCEADLSAVHTLALSGINGK